MAVFPCGKCGHVREVPSECIGRSGDCPRCKQAGAVHDTVKLLERPIGEYRAQRAELRSFVAKYFHGKDDRIAWLTLRTAHEIVKFFNGEWLERYVLPVLGVDRDYDLVSHRQRRAGRRGRPMANTP